MVNSVHQNLLTTTPTEDEAAINDYDPTRNSLFQESKNIWSVALPSVISGLASFGGTIVTQSIIGHISSTDLAAFGLVQTISLQFTNGIVQGMSSATETLCGQAYGAKQGHMLGIFLQRSWLISLIATTILLPVFLFATPIFKLLGQDKAIAESTGYISLWFIPLLYAIAFSSPTSMYLQSQEKNGILAWIELAKLVIHISISWLFFYVLNWGTPGAVAALCISAWFSVFGEFTYIFGGWCPHSWKGFTMEALKDLFPVLKLSISSAVMVSLYSWYYSILLLLAGYMKNAEVAVSAFSICLNINSLEYMITGSLSGAATVRVANEIGRGDEKATRFSIKVLSSTSILLGLFFWIICSIFGYKLGHLFTNDSEVATSVSDLSLLLALSMLLDGFYPVPSGVAVGAGLQTKVAIINLCSYYVIGVPVGVVLGYMTNLKVKGIWIGLITGMVAQTFALSFLTWRTNWSKEISKTSARLKKWLSESSNENIPISDDHA